MPIYTPEEMITKPELRITAMELAIGYLKGLSDDEDRLLNLAERIHDFLSDPIPPFADDPEEEDEDRDRSNDDNFPF